MTVSVKVDIDRTQPAEDTFTVRFEVVERLNIDFEVFVHTTEDGVFSHVASVYDLETYPDNQAEAVLSNVVFYRSRTAEVTYETPTGAQQFETVTRNRLKILTDEWDTVITAFPASSTVTITSEDD